MRRSVVALACLVLAACAGGEAEPTTSAGGSPEVPRCRDLGWMTAPEEMYGDSPVYVGNEMPIEEVVAYAQTMEGFVEAWIDREHNGWINVGFAHSDIGAAQEELSAVFPDEGVVAVELPRDIAELEAVLDRVTRILPPEFQVSGYHPLHGRVEIWLGVLDDDRVARVAALVGDEPVCVDGEDPATALRPGPQRPDGDGWSYLAEFDTTTGSLHVTGDPDSYRDLWAALGGTAAPPEVDFEGRVVIALEIGYSGSCPRTRLDAVEFEAGAVRLEINTITEEMGCTDDYNPRTYLVALDRDRLPAPPFTVERLDWPRAAGSVVDDLRIPGSEAGALEEAPVPAPEVGIPEFIEPGFPTTARLDLSCGIEFLTVNHVDWRADQAAVPDEWLAAADGSVVQVSVLVAEGPEPTLTLGAAGREVVYHPGDPDPTPCFDDLP